MIKINKEFISGVVIGFGSGLAVRAVSGQEKVSLRGIVKGTLRTSLSTFEKLKDGIAKTKENFEDLTAEVKSEIQSEKETKAEVKATSNEPIVEPELAVASE